MQLPESLQPWAPWLAWFGPEQWPVFADLLGHIDPLLGPVRGGQGGPVEPAGLGDVQRRGPYERLLTSEWLLADEAPDEFLRRAATGEHLFLAPEHRAQTAQARLVVLLDAGPRQWGAPRLVQLALLIVLARRAQVAGAVLQWGILQTPGILATLDSAHALKQVLSARTESAATAQFCEQWRISLAEQPAPFAESWLVGGQSEPQALAAPFSHRVRVQRSFDGEHIHFELDGVRRQSLLLPLPDRAAGQRLLSGQFESLTSSPRGPQRSWRVALTVAPVISPGGRHVALTLLDEPGSLVFHLPAAGEKKPRRGQRQLWCAGLEPVAAFFAGNRFSAVLSTATALEFWKVPTLRHIKTPARGTLKIPMGTARLLPCAWLSMSKPRLYCLDTEGQLVYWHCNERGQTQLVSVQPTVVGLARTGHESLAYVTAELGELLLYRLDSRGLAMEPCRLGPSVQGVQVLFAGYPDKRPGFVACAVRHGQSLDTAGVWHLHERADEPTHATTLHVDAGHKVIGQLRDVDDQQSSLVIMGGGDQRFSLFTHQQMEPLFNTASPVVKHSFCPVSGLLAVLTDQRELLVFCTRERRMRLQVMCTDSADTQEAP